MIYLDTMTNAQLALLLVAVAVGAVVIGKFSFWLAIKIVHYCWPMTPQKTADEIKLEQIVAKWHAEDMAKEAEAHEPRCFDDQMCYDITIYNPDTNKRW